MQFVSEIIACFGICIDGNGKTVRRKFQYTTIFPNHFWYQHKINDHNNNCHSLPSLEETWITHRWANSVFTFFLAICKANAYLAYNYFIWRKNPSGFKKPTVHQFHRTLANDLTHNMFLKDNVTCNEENRKRRKAISHELMVALYHAKTSENGNTKQNNLTSNALAVPMVAANTSNLITYAPQVLLGCVSHSTLTTLCGAWQAKKVTAELSIAIFLFCVFLGIK